MIPMRSNTSYSNVNTDKYKHARKNIYIHIYKHNMTWVELIGFIVTMWKQTDIYDLNKIS